jgi:hypothetical protein
MPPWKCANPEYLRTVENGVQIFMYRFRITNRPHDILTVSRGMDQTSLQKALLEHSLTDDEYKSYLIDFFNYLLSSQHSRFFNKKYTAEQYGKFIIHNFNNLPIVDGDATTEHTCTLNPVELVLKSGKIYLNWSVELASMIDFQLEEEQRVAAQHVEEQRVEELSPAAVTGGKAATNGGASGIPVTALHPGSDILEVDDVAAADDADNEIIAIRSGHSGGSQAMSDKQNRDRQRVEEARLRAKLASVRAERALERYIQKYGDYETDMTSDDEQTETEFDSE